MKQPINKTALRKAGGKPANAPIKASRSVPIAADRKWEVEDAMRTIMRAEELKRDGKLMADVKKHAAAQAAKMQSICKK